MDLKLLSQNKRSFFILLYFGIMPSLMGGIIAGVVIDHVVQLRESNILLLFGINLLASFFLAIGFIPTTIYSLLCGYILGWVALPMVLISYTIACILGYFICKKVENGNLFSFLQSKYDINSYKLKLENAGLEIVALCRLSPALPFAILNAVFAMVKFPLGKYMVGSMLGMIPRTALAVYVGRSFINVRTVEDLKSNSSLWITIVFALISFAGIGWIVKKKFS